MMYKMLCHTTVGLNWCVGGKWLAVQKQYRKYVDIAKDWGCFGGQIIVNGPTNWWLCGWKKLAGMGMRRALWSCCVVVGGVQGVLL
jgi:hypothetical protein